MKKFLFIVAVALTSVGYAQTDKGDWMVGTDFGLSYQSSKETVKAGNERSVTTNTFRVAPKLDYFVINNLSIGLGLEYANTKIKDVSGSTNEFAVVPQVHYFFPLDTNLKPFIGAKVGYGFSSSGSEDAQKWNGLVLGGKAGVAYFVNNGAAVTGYVGYDHHNFKNKADKDITRKTGTLGVGIGVAIFF